MVRDRPLLTHLPERATTEASSPVLAISRTGCQRLHLQQNRLSATAGGQKELLRSPWSVDSVCHLTS